MSDGTTDHATFRLRPQMTTLHDTRRLAEGDRRERETLLSATIATRNSG